MASRAMRVACLVLATMCVDILSSVAGEGAPALTQEDRADLAFFGGLGFPDLAGRAYIEVTTGGGSVDEEEGEHIPTLRGFLLSEGEGGTFRVLTEELLVLTCVTTPDGTPRHERVGYTVLDLASEVRQLHTSASESMETDEKDPLSGIREEMAARFGERLSLRGRLLALAWACHRNELDEEAHLMLELARKVGAFWNRETDEGTLREDLYEEFATAMIWRAVEAFGDAAILRTELLERFQTFLGTFARSEHAKTAREAVELLTRMVAEDEAHAQAAKPFDEMSKHEQIADLIFRLRDQNGGQFMQPGSPSIFLSLGDVRDENTPAHQLVARGHDAVPQLIEALTDRRFTRTVGFWRNFTYSHYVVRIGDASLDILERIARRSFWEGGYTAASMVKDGEENETQARVRAWWKEVQQKGERQTLIHAVHKADGNSTRAASQLLKKYPEDALPAILKGLGNCRDNRTRFYFIQMLAIQVPGDAHAPVMLEELRTGPDLDCRFRAATWLIRHGYVNEALPPMIAAWRTLDDEDPNAMMGPDWFAGFLVQAGTTEAIRALAEGFGERSTGFRYEALDWLGRCFPRHESLPPMGEDADVLLEAFLVDALSDLEDTGRSSSSSLGSVDDIRVADKAAQVLARKWGDHDAFELYAPLHVRDQQIHALRNRWRVKRGMQALPDPEAQPLPQLPEREARVLLDGWRAAATPEARRDAVRAIERKGLAILGAVREASAEEGGAALEDVAKRLAFCVRDVEVRPDGAALGKRTQANLDALRGRPLTRTALFGLLDALVAEFPNGAQGFSVTVNRIGNDRGAVARLHVVPLPRGREIREGGFWEVRPYFRVRRRTADTWSSSGDGVPRSEDWESFREIAEATFLAEVDAPVRIRVAIRRGLTRKYPDPIPIERILKDAGLDPEEKGHGE